MIIYCEFIEDEFTAYWSVAVSLHQNPVDNRTPSWIVELPRQFLRIKKKKKTYESTLQIMIREH